ncbi:TlyA family RNA methyltransferase [Sporolactobacillus laevolacticus]|uniref:rRNA methyltransferase n=1 Tax=Sporolactobacillus laevolacticus DSM 442 TaxID=1395513 RepID=V6IV49_9BACL|nr:TlyA family RNA methyltransferase [Sporolactobacillus laevolacticus]EST11073.1 rRNA methyltransferase [Sporolactobacillus laevolacticus DSM 442]MDN3956225.1 TlyA family RNA methyltransferase [Sporolactobacillus laevolacticus]
MKDRERVDVLLVKQGLFDSREKAQRAVMAGMVYHDDQRVDKPGSKVDSTLEFTIKGNLLPYVGRGGLKLEKALKVFDLDLSGLLMLDIGASTGGFTDCALQNGARKVYALDVGYNQLAWKLRSDPRVVVMEKTNFRYCTLDDFQDGQPDFASIDVSFISLKKILPALVNILKNEGEVVALIKPQFEAGRDEVGKKGIVHDPKVHLAVVQDILQFAISCGFSILDLNFSPITGGDGNIEFLAYFRSDKNHAENLMKITPEDVVRQAHQNFRKNTKA